MFSRLLLSNDQSGLSPAGGKILETLCFAVHSSANQLKCSYAADILFSISLVCPTALRLTVLNGPKCLVAGQISGKLHPFLVLVCEIIWGNDSGLVDTVGDTVKMCLEFDSDCKSVREKFLNEFYDHYLAWLLLPFSEKHQPHLPLACSVRPVDFDSSPVNMQSSSGVSTSRRVIFEILSSCVNLHGYRMKYFLIRNNTIALCNKVFQSPFRCMHLGALRLLRDVIAKADEAFHRHIIKFDLLRPIVSSLETNNRDNLIRASVLGLLELIRKENMRLLVNYIVERFENQLVEASVGGNVVNVVLDGLRLRYEQNRSGVSDAQQLQLLPQIDRHNLAFLERESEAAYFSDDVMPVGKVWGKNVGVDEEDAGGGDVQVIESLDSLPPLRAKFEVDEAVCDVFTLKPRKQEEQSKSSHVGSNRDGSSNSDSNRAAFSFVVKKRSVSAVL